MGEQHLDLTVRARPPEPDLAGGLAQHLAVGPEQPGPGLIGQERAAVVGEHQLLTHRIGTLDGRVDDLAGAPPHADQRQQRQAVRVQVGALAQVRGVVRDGQVVEPGPVAAR